MREAHTDTSDRRDLVIVAHCKIPACAGMTRYL